MFWLLKGATRSPRRARARHSPVTTRDLPASELVPVTSSPATQRPYSGRVRDPVTVHLVRHGQSTWNVEGRLQGQTVHPELTERGRREAAEAAALLRARCPGTGEDVGLICSDLVRAAQTAAVIGQVLGVSVEQDVALREQGLGVLEGRLTKELVALRAEVRASRSAPAAALEATEFRLDAAAREELPPPSTIPETSAPEVQAGATRQAPYVSDELRRMAAAGGSVQDGATTTGNDYDADAPAARRAAALWRPHCRT